VRFLPGRVITADSLPVRLFILTPGVSLGLAAFSNRLSLDPDTGQGTANNAYAHTLRNFHVQFTGIIINLPDYVLYTAKLELH
jgi:hypothetical protein